MKRVILFLINVFITINIFSQEKIDALNILEDFYSGKDVVLDDALSICQKASTENVENYILSYTALSTLMSTANNDEYKKMFDDFEKSILSIIIKNKNYQYLHLVTNYLYSKFSWQKDTFDLVSDLPSLYQLNYLENKDESSLLDMAIWYTSVANTKTIIWNSYIKENEKLIDSLNLTKIEKFNALLSYSIFYFKNLETDKGFEFLERAKEIYPESIHVAIIEINLMNGKGGW